LLDQLRELRIDCGLAAADRDDRRLRALHRLDALVERQPVLELAGVALDRAADAREVARVEGLEHQHERVALVAPDCVAHRVLNRVGHDVSRESHQFTPWSVWPGVAGSLPTSAGRVAPAASSRA